MPDARAVEELLELLLDDDVQVGLSDGRAPEEIVAVYAGDGGEVRALCVCERTLAALLGASLGRIPAGVAKEGAAAPELPEGLLANYHEVANVCARLLSSDASPHLRLLSVHSALDESPEAAQRFARIARRRVDLAVEIASYGSGRMSFLAV